MCMAETRMPSINRLFVWIQTKRIEMDTEENIDTLFLIDTFAKFKQI